MATYEIRGLKEIYRTIRNFRGQVWHNVEDALAEVAESVAAQAKSNATANYYTGNLVEKITARYPKNRKGVRTSQYIHYVVSSSPEGHLVEFGTGRQYELPLGLELGRPSKASGHHTGFFGKKAQARLVEWAAYKGAANPIEAAAAIAAVLEKDGGVRPKPYLFPALLAHEHQLLTKLHEAIADAVLSANAQSGAA